MEQLGPFGDNATVTLGSYDRTLSAAKHHGIIQSIQHPDYGSGLIKHDVGLLELKETIVFDGETECSHNIVLFYKVEFQKRQRLFHSWLGI